MLSADVFGAMPRIPCTDTTSPPTKNPVDNTAFESELPDASLLGDNIFNTSVIVSPRTPPQSLPDFFTP